MNVLIGVFVVARFLPNTIVAIDQDAVPGDARGPALSRRILKAENGTIANEYRV